MTPRPLGACIRHGYGNSIHAKQSDCVNWFPVAEGVAAPLEPTPRPIGFCDKERKPHEVKHDCLNWSECRVSRPKPTQPTAEEAKHLEALISEVGDGYGINPSCCSLLTDDLPDEGSLAGGILRAFELGRAAVSKNPLIRSDTKSVYGYAYAKEGELVCEVSGRAWYDTACILRNRLEVAEKEITALREKPHVQG